MTSRWSGCKKQLLDNEDEVKLLVAADNQPLKALELASSDAYEVQQSFIADVCGVLTGHCSIRQCVTKAAKLGEHACYRLPAQSFDTSG